jgi:hypothetical protein
MSCNDPTDYSYSAYIATPNSLGISDKGSTEVLDKDIKGLIAYTEVLTMGTGKASTTGKPLGNKYFMTASSKCKDTVTGKDKDRYIYINNVPQGQFAGLLPGLIGNVAKINPMSIISSALESSTKPDCKEITLETIDCNNGRSYETHYVAVSDIKNDGLVDVPDKRKQGFQGMTPPKMPDDTMSQIYFAGLASLGVILFYKLMVNRIRDR